MHYGNLVIIEKTDDIEAAVEQAMGPNEENGGFWDWYQIGGRWTGSLDGFDAAKDPANLGEDGREKWPTQWAKHPGDIAPVETLTEEAYDNFFRIVIQGRGIFGGEQYLPWKTPGEEMFPRNERPPLEWLKKEYAGHLMVVVDNHN